MKVRAILFDLHHTLTKTNYSALDLMRNTAISVGVDLSSFTDEELQVAVDNSEEWMWDHQIQNNVDIHWGDDPIDWIEPVRIVFDELGFPDISDKKIIEMETNWKAEIKTGRWESFTEDSLFTLNELKNRGYMLGICTRRNDDPEELLKVHGVWDMFSVVEWTGVKGYAKPSPYTLLIAAQTLRLNPRLCAFVGNYVDVDVLAAIRAEMLPVLTTWANPEEVEKAPEETLVVTELKEMLEYF